MANAWFSNGAGATIGNVPGAWVIPAQLADGTNVVLRNFVKPSQVWEGVGKGEEVWSPSLKYIKDEHLRAGPILRMFYFLSQGSSKSSLDNNYASALPGGMTGIGNEEATAIWYRTLSTYLSSTSDFADARKGALAAAADLYGDPSPEVTAVSRAFAAIKVGKPDVSQPGAVTVTATATSQGSNLQLQATPSGAAGHVLFFVDGIPVGRSDAAPFQVTLDAGRLLSNGNHVLTAHAFGDAGLLGKSGQVAFLLANPIQQVVANPGFEGGTQGCISTRWTGWISMPPAPRPTGAPGWSPSAAPRGAAPSRAW
jgi:hypothetical protein